MNFSHEFNEFMNYTNFNSLFSAKKFVQFVNSLNSWLNQFQYGKKNFTEGGNYLPFFK
jgi:hypothetical protein